MKNTDHFVCFHLYFSKKILIERYFTLIIILWDFTLRMRFNQHKCIRLKMNCGRVSEVSQILVHIQQFLNKQSTNTFNLIFSCRCQCPSHHLTDKYETYIKEIFTNNIFDFLIFINGQKTDEE